MPEYHTGGGLTVIEGLEAVRRRPELYVGADEPNKLSQSARILELALTGLSRDTPRPTAIRVYVWNDALTIAVDGKPLPVEPFTRGTSDLPHPALYQFFMSLAGQTLGRTLAFGGVMNALSERLVVSTMHGEMRCRAVFAQGQLAMLLSRSRCEAPLGTTWLTWRRDHTLLKGPTLEHPEAVAIAAKIEAPQVQVYNRGKEEPDWY